MCGIGGCGYGGEAAAMECTGHGDEALALALPLEVEVAAYGLESAFDGFGAGVTEEDAIGEGI